MNTSRTPLFYMANLGSEISRALLEYQGKEFEKMHDSLGRAKNIIKKIVLPLYPHTRKPWA